MKVKIYITPFCQMLKELPKQCSVKFEEVYGQEDRGARDDPKDWPEWRPGD